MSPEPPHEGLRAGDRDREAVAQVLHTAMAEGRLELHEVDERLARTDAARVEGWGWGKVTNRHRAPAAPGRPTLVVTGSIGDGTVKTRGAYFYE